jgi:beta-phosphoglucomutase-like phosphatase (HAD superfamily)
VATSSSTERAGAALSITGIGDLVEGRVFTSSMVKRAKPAPDLFLLAAEKNGVKAFDCLVIEDSEMGLEAARAAGMLVWRFTGGSHYAAGYRRHMEGPAADRNIAHFGEALAILEGLGALKPTFAA